MTLTTRQQAILDIVRRTGPVATRDIRTALAETNESVTRLTVIRDLDALVRAKLVLRSGKGRAVRYGEVVRNASQRFIDPVSYFALEDDRRGAATAFRIDALDAFSDTFTAGEMAKILSLNEAYRRRKRSLSPGVIRKEMERFTAEFSWKSSQIEGNTYSLLDTEVLLTQRQEAAGHPHAEAQMILNHKTALDFVAAHPRDYAALTVRTVEQLHALIIKDLGVAKGLRNAPVGILGTEYRPLRLRSQIREALLETTKLINGEPFAPAKALIALLMIAYIQPFEDGNKRTARLLGNAFLIAADFCPLSYRSIDEKEYKKAVVLFYEQNNVRYFKQLFLEQFAYATGHYFLS